MPILRRQVPAILVSLFALSACVSVAVKPEDCPAGTQKLEYCPPVGAVDDAAIQGIHDERTWRSASELDDDPIELGRVADIPINHASVKFIGSTDAGALTSLTAKIHLIEQAEHTVDVVYYIFRHDLSGLAILGALCDAVERGVDVRIMVDSLGSSNLKKTYLKALESCALEAGFMRNADGELTIYRARVQPVIFNAASRIFINFNRRSHDKLLVIDGGFPDKAAVMTGGRNIALDYFGILADGSPNPHTYRDAEILLRGGATERNEKITVGRVSEIYYTLLFLFKNNKRLKMTRMSHPATAYKDERELFRDSLSTLKALPALRSYFAEMPRYVAEQFHDTEVRLAHELANMTDKKVVANAVENADLNPNSITTILRRARGNQFKNVQIVSPYMFAALHKDRDGTVVLDEAQNMLHWLESNSDSTVELVTNSVLTSDNFFTQAVIDMDLAPRLLLSDEMQAAWLEKPDKSELNPELVKSEEWVDMTDRPRLKIFETGKLDDQLFGGEYHHSKLHAKYVVFDDHGFVGTTNFDYRSRLYNNEMGFFFLSEALADDIRANTAYLIGLSYRWGSPEWLEMRRQIMAEKGRKASTTRKQRGLYKTLKNTGLQWFF